MIDLKSWLTGHDLSVREFALELEVPLKTAQDWIYRGTVPSAENQRKLDEFMACTHHWVIESPNGHVSRGVCKLCQEVRGVENSIHADMWIPRRRDNG